MLEFRVNGTAQRFDADPSTPILWVVRERLGLNGTKFGCGIAQCGACTVHLNGQPVRGCVTPIAAANGQDITTIEGIAAPDGTLHAVQQAWIDHQVPQCGYCQSGQIMSAVALLDTHPAPTDEQIDGAMRGNVCRCGMYGRIRSAIKAASETSAVEDSEEVVRMFEVNDAAATGGVDHG